MSAPRSSGRSETARASSAGDALAHVDCWIFDLDNTLYPASADLFGPMRLRMRDYIADRLGCDRDEAHRLQRQWYDDHGTTLAGLMAHHNVDPRHFLDNVHDIALDHLVAHDGLNAAIRELPGRKLIYTNADVDYTQRVLAALGLSDIFEQVHDIHACAYRPKPDPWGYQLLCDSHNVEPTRAIFFEDLARNLPPAKALGMATVWIDDGSDPGGDRAAIDFATPDLAAFLATLIQELKPSCPSS